MADTLQQTVTVESAEPAARPHLHKCPTGIVGLDDITEGGLPRGRTTLVAGKAGCGKTLMALEFLVRGATQFDEPGVFICFEETAPELCENTASLGWDLDLLVENQRIAIDAIRLSRDQIAETGEYDLSALFVRLDQAIKSVGAKRVALDTIEVLFAGLDNTAVVRSELRRLFRWLKERDLTAIITGERGASSLTRHGLEEYVSDCVIMLDHRVTEELSTRRLRIVKYRGSCHKADEFPFLIGSSGIAVLPLSGVGLDHEVANERISSGVVELDEMLRGGGFYRGSSVLLSGTAGTGKSTLAAHFVNAACLRGERALYFAFEESPQQIVRNMRTIGIDLQQWLDAGLLRFLAARPSMSGLEAHLVRMHEAVQEHEPSIVIADPISNLYMAGDQRHVKSFLLRLIDSLKGAGITAVFSSLTHGGTSVDATELGVSSLMDSWVLLLDVESNAERNRVIYVLKSRGIANSNQMREFAITERGIKLMDVYVGPEGVLTGSARLAQETREKAAATERQEEIERKRREIELEQETLETQIETLRAEFEAKRREVESLVAEAELRESVIVANRDRMARSRGVEG